MVEKTLNHLAKKLSGVEGEEKDKLRVIHDLAANGMEANLLSHKRKGSMVWEIPMRSHEERSKQGIIQKSDEDRRRNSDFKLIRYSLEEFKKYILKERDPTDVKLKNLHKQYNIIENTLQAKTSLPRKRNLEGQKKKQ